MKKFILTEIDGVWTIEQIICESIYPTTKKQDDRAMIARLMQLIGVGPVAPQTEPEKVGINGI